MKGVKMKGAKIRRDERQEHHIIVGLRKQSSTNVRRTGLAEKRVRFSCFQWLTFTFGSIRLHYGYWFSDPSILLS